MIQRRIDKTAATFVPSFPRWAAAQLAVVLLAGFPTAAAAQNLGRPEPEPIPDPGVFATGSLGTGVEAMGGHLGLHIPFRGGALVLRHASVSEFELFKTPSASVADVAVLYGFTALTSRGWGRASLGVGWATEVTRGAVEELPDTFFGVTTYERRENRSLGVALQLDGVWAFTDGLGLGANVFANVSGVRPLAGASLGLVLGDLR